MSQVKTDVIIVFALCLQVKKVFAQVIIAMAHHGYLELEGGHHMIEFIVRQCTLEPEPKVQFLSNFHVFYLTIMMVLKMVKFNLYYYKLEIRI